VLRNWNPVLLQRARPVVQQWQMASVCHHAYARARVPVVVRSWVPSAEGARQ
jgi:hypothetical protein